jgi:hypothetical protein
MPPPIAHAYESSRFRRCLRSSIAEADAVEGAVVAGVPTVALASTTGAGVAMVVGAVSDMTPLSKYDVSIKSD